MGAKFSLVYCHKVYSEDGAVKGGWALSNTAVCQCCPSFSACKVRQPIIPSKETPLYVLSRGMCQEVGTFKNTVNGVEITFNDEEANEVPDSEEGQSVYSEENTDRNI